MTPAFFTPLIRGAASPASGGFSFLRPNRIPLRLPRIPVVHLEQPLAPRVDRIVALEEPRRRDGARPLEGAEQDVIGEARTVAGKKGVLHQNRPERVERAAKRRHRALRIGAALLERHAQALLARLAE